MNILILSLVLLSVILGIFVITPSKKSGQKLSKEKEPVQPEEPVSVDHKETLISTLEEQLFSAKDELDKVRAGYINVQAEFETAKKREFELREELIRQKDWYDKKIAELEKLKDDYLPLKDKLEKEISEDINLNKEIKEKNDLIECLKSKNKELFDEVLALKVQLQKYGPQSQ